jgi:ABC-type branched-subunit amino acid transport system substrate-binding protein
MAGAACSPYVVSTSFQNDQFTESLGKLLTDEKIASIYLMAPNYQAGKDLVNGLKRTLKNAKIVGETFFKLGETDYQADISKVRALKPAALFVFAPGAMHRVLQAMAASGIGKDGSSTRVSRSIGHAAGHRHAASAYHACIGAPTSLPQPAFRKDYTAKHGHALGVRGTGL